MTFWGSEWAKQNTLNGVGSAFKGFANNPSSKATRLRRRMDDRTRQQLLPSRFRPRLHGHDRHHLNRPDGNTISGNITHIVVVVTDPGYASNPGHPGTGTGTIHRHLLLKPLNPDLAGMLGVYDRRLMLLSRVPRQDSASFLLWVRPGRGIRVHGDRLVDQSQIPIPSVSRHHRDEAADVGSRRCWWRHLRVRGDG